MLCGGPKLLLFTKGNLFTEVSGGCFALLHQVQKPTESQCAIRAVEVRLTESLCEASEAENKSWESAIIRITIYAMLYRIQVQMTAFEIILKEET